MDEITDQVPQLSLAAKEWRPGLGLAPTPKNSLSSTTSAPNLAGIGSGGSSTSAFSKTGAAVGGGGVSSQSSWGGAQPQAAVDVNGTHYFGGGGATGGVSSTSSWESSRHHHHPQSSTDIHQNINTTIPAYQKNRKSSQQDGLQHHATTLSNSLSLPAEEYHHYREMTFESSREMEPNDPRHKAVPPTFCRAYCLDNDTDGTSSMTTQQRSSFGYPTSLFRVTSTTDGNLYCLRRLDSVRCVSHKIAQTVMHKWLMNDTGFDHPGIVKWYKCFLSNRAVFFVHHYYPGAVTLRERFFSNSPQQGGQGGNVPLPESLIWSCLVQLVSAIRAVHGSNLAVRTLQLNHILCTQETPSSATVSGAYGLPKLRLRINCVGIIDTLEFEARRSTEELKQSDMRALGCLLLSMCTGTEVTVNDIFDRRNISMQEQQQRGQMVLDYMNFVQQNYSREMYVLVHSLLNPNQPPNNIHGVATSMTMRAFDELDATHGCMDDMHSALLGIYESGRALKLLLKLAFVNERPEMGFDRNWSESGDCYVLKLFRDFVFHQADEGGRPVMDLGHVVSSLNKLDAADEEKIVLTSRDGKNVLVVSFADIAFVLEKAYQELIQSSVPTPSIAA